MGLIHKMSGMLRREKPGPAVPEVHLAAFGKHPGWNDHMEDLGMESEHLVHVKNVLYWEGLKGNLDAGSWQKLEQDHRLEKFDHLFVWRTGLNVDFGSIWASSDGKSRKDFPMIVCASGEHVGLEWMLDEAPPVLDEVREACTSTKDPAGVMRAIDEGRRALRVKPPAPASRHARVPVEMVLRRFREESAFRSDQEGLIRLLYVLGRELKVQEPRTGTWVGREPVFHIRVPGCRAGALESVTLWTRAFDEMAPDRPLFVVRPRAGSWVDVFLGTPGKAELFVLLASDLGAPIASEIPYEIEGALRTDLHRRLFGG